MTNFFDSFSWQFIFREFTSPTPGYGPVHPPRSTRASLNRSSSDGAANNGKGNNGSLSDTALAGSTTEQGAKQSQQSTVGGKMPQFGGLSAKRSNSTSQLSVSGEIIMYYMFMQLTLQ